jgi:cyclophilin family peptidyl-prolyl cis-trans isomerase
MAKTNAPNSGGSQFFITFRPTPNLNGIHTVFGRVIEGMDAVDRIQRREADKADAPDADKILKAEVLRKRDHEYLPHKVE